MLYESPFPLFSGFRCSLGAINTLTHGKYKQAGQSALYFMRVCGRKPAMGKPWHAMEDPVHYLYRRTRQRVTEPLKQFSQSNCTPFARHQHNSDKCACGTKGETHLQIGSRITSGWSRRRALQIFNRREPCVAAHSEAFVPERPILCNIGPSTLIPTTQQLVWTNSQFESRFKLFYAGISSDDPDIIRFGVYILRKIHIFCLLAEK
jgi:hypothetical protein